MRDRRGYARLLTAGLSLALALFASGCLVAEGAEEDDEAPKLAQESASTTPAVDARVAAGKATAAPVADTRGMEQSPALPGGALTVENDVEEAATPPEDSEADYDDTTAAHEQIVDGAHGDGVFCEPPPHPYTPPPLR